MTKNEFHKTMLRDLHKFSNSDAAEELNQYHESMSFMDWQENFTFYTEVELENNANVCKKAAGEKL